ncbi:T9SS type A sorting domain-containing protein [Polaribacter vadi]|nr:T9SS type A sorting domain-containing protein [Polaribacter vadi]
MIKNKIIIFMLLICLFSTNIRFQSQVPDPDLGLRADWMRGSLGMLWLPENNYGGNIEGKRIDDFLNQISHLKTIDFIQVGLASPYIYSPVHTAPHTILESLWQGDTDNGDLINLVVPRAEVDDPFLSWLKAIRAAGLKTEVYVNSCNLLQWEAFGDAPDAFPDFSNRWKAYCDENLQDFIDSKDYHTDGVNDDRRPYMFCYAEFILKEYATRYGDLIDAWCFDAAHVNMGAAGDDFSTGDIKDQRIYQAFADAVHAGNPNAAVTFNNGIGDRDSDPFLPYKSPSIFEDYKFGHPFGGAGNMVEPRDPLYTVNFGVCEYMRDNNGLPYTGDNIDWNDNVVAHFFPKQSKTSWNDGGAPCLTDEEFVEWNNVGLINGGGITWGTPLVRTNLNNSPDLTLQPYALTQFELVDADLSVNQFPGEPNWARQYTILPTAYNGIKYNHTLTEGVDFWDPEGDVITSLIAQNNFPSWLTIAETSTGVWTLSGMPAETEDTNYEFDLRASDTSGGRNRTVNLKVIKELIIEPKVFEVDIQATENTTYNSGAVTMIGVGKIPSYEDVFNIEITVTPIGDFTTNPNAVIVSGTSDTKGNSTSKSWGISNDGTNDASNDRIFAGNEQFSATISNARITNITGSLGLTSDNIIIDTFKSITIVNGQSIGDRFTFSADGSADFNLDQFENEIVKVVDLVSESSDNQIESFTIKNGSTATNDKWSVDKITVQVTINTSSLSVQDFKNESKAFKLYPNPAKDNISFNRQLHKVKIIDVTGKTLINFINETNNIDTSYLRSGVYTLKGIDAKGQIITKKIIKQTPN